MCLIFACVDNDPNNVRGHAHNPIMDTASSCCIVSQRQHWVRRTEEANHILSFSVSLRSTATIDLTNEDCYADRNAQSSSFRA